MIQPHKIYTIILKNGEEINGQAVVQKAHSKIFKIKSGKKIEVRDEDIKSHEMIKDLLDVPYQHKDSDTKLKFKKSGTSADLLGE